MVRRHSVPRRWTLERAIAERARRRMENRLARRPSNHTHFYFTNIYRRFPVLLTMVRLMRDDQESQMLVDRLLSDCSDVIPPNLQLSNQAIDLLREIAELHIIQIALDSNQL